MPAGRNPYGIIDDIFEPLGKAVVHQVRTAVRNAIHAEARIAKQTAKQAKIKDKAKKAFDKDAKVVKGLIQGRPAASAKTKNARVQNAKIQSGYVQSKYQNRVSGAKPTYTDRAKEVRTHARSYFRNEGEFNAAMREELRSIKRETKKKGK